MPVRRTIRLYRRARALARSDRADKSAGDDSEIRASADRPGWKPSGSARQDGRDAGRRRPPILSEAEFLARRETSNA